MIKIESKKKKEKILKLLKNNEKMKIPIGQRRSNPEKLNKDNIEDIIKNLNLENKNRKEKNRDKGRRSKSQRNSISK